MAAQPFVLSQRDCGNQPRVARNAPPWVRRPKELLVTLKRVAAVTEDFGQGLPRRPRVSLRLTQPISGLMSANDALPRVARRALPWAERLHPFRITRGRVFTLVVQLQHHCKDVGNDKLFGMSLRDKRVRSNAIVTPCSNARVESPK